MGLDGLWDVLFPPACAACAKVLAGPGDGVFCAACASGLELLPEAHCPSCAEPGDFPLGACPRCRLYPPPFSRAYGPFAHAGPVARAIHRFKYEDHPELALPLAQLLARAAQAFLAQAPDAVCALPLHASRFRERQYDQAQLLSRALAQVTGRQHLPRALERVRATKRQVGQSEVEREANVSGAFVAPRPLPGARVLLVDDVFTTGATARAAAAALRDAGAAEVQVVTVARAYTL